MEIFGPQNLDKAPNQPSDDNYEKTDSLTLLKDSKSERTEPKPELLIDKTHESVLTTIETELYIAKVSSFNSGSIKDFFLKDFLSPDSQEVNTIARNKKNNLEIEIQDLNGDPIPLNGNWALISQPNRSDQSSEQGLEYSLEVFPGKEIRIHAGSC